MDKTLLHNLTEYQKSLLTRLSYIEIDLNLLQYLKQNQAIITISDLEQLLSRPNEPYLGCLHSHHIKKMISGVTTTSLEFIKKLIEAGLGDLELVDLANDKESGFNAICFKDSNENIGFSFRGTDVKTFSSLAADSLADVEAFLTNNTEQIHQAQTFFDKHKNHSRKNFLYGHSLGGFLAENIYLQNSQDISNTFVINPLHINSKLLDTPARIALFNNSRRFSCFVTGGDYISMLNPPELFANNIHYIRNNNKYANNLIGNHLVECGEIKNGSFVVCPYEDAYAGREIPIAATIIHTINDNHVKEFFSKTFLVLKKWILSAKSSFSNIFLKKQKSKIANAPKNTSNTTSHSALDEHLNPKNYIGPNYSQVDWENAQRIINSRKFT